MDNKGKLNVDMLLGKQQKQFHNHDVKNVCKTIYFSDPLWPIKSRCT